MSDSHRTMNSEEIARSIIPVAPPVPAPRHLENSQEKAGDSAAIMDALVSTITILTEWKGRDTVELNDLLVYACFRTLNGRLDSTERLAF